MLRHAKGLPQVPAMPRPVTTVDKENVSPLSLDTNGCPTAAVPVPVAHPHQLGPFIPTGIPPVLTLLSMTLCGHPITFDLKSLDDDPRSIIELLTSTSSDRDKWMIVGAFYRRKGNIHAALIVVTTMVKGLWEPTSHLYFGDPQQHSAKQPGTQRVRYEAGLPDAL
jgi:hypothetical protein